MGKELLKRKKLKSFSQKPQLSKKENQAALPNSLVMRIMQESDAEGEADRLSDGVTSTSPSALKQEMGERLGADFSNVHFHTDINSIQRSAALNAQAWTQGRDVYFGKDGFNPAIAAHELVHTVQQGAVRGNVSQSVPMGAVQLKPNGEDQTEEDEIDPNIKIDNNTDVQALLAQMFNTKNGERVYHALESDLFALIKKGAGTHFRRCSKESGIIFLAQAAEKDYAGKTVLANILRRSFGTDHFARKRLFDFQEFIGFLSNRLRESDLEEAAMDANVMADPPRFQHNQGQNRKRAYEMDVPGKDSDEINFNPGNDPELTKVQSAIDKARNPEQAYKVFSTFAGNSSGQYINQIGTKTNLTALKKKLKNMTRVVRDYPELQGQIGNMTVWNPETKYMSSERTFDEFQKAQLYYNSHFDTDEGIAERDRLFGRKGYLAGNIHFSGTHELGHVLAPTLIDEEDPFDAFDMHTSGKQETEIMESVFKNQDIMPEKDYKKLQRYTKDEQEKSENVWQKPRLLEGTIHTEKNKLYAKGYTSKYGMAAPDEFFAEAFHDVYANGKKARKASIATVQEYEERQKKLTAEKFFRKKRSWWRRFVNWIKL